jgi:6-pyruvoyltetrahydropterin/6-carboxytetrahydropterin synthase
MYEVKIITHFSASHHLRDYEGPCEQVHGHNWKVEVVYESQKLDNIGMVIDFKLLRSKVNGVLDQLDHTDLNAHEYFQKFNPSSETIASFVFLHLAKDPDLNEKARLKRVDVWETDTSCAGYYE